MYRKHPFSLALIAIFDRRKTLLQLFLLIPFLAVINACGPSDFYSQSYVILVNRNRVGREIVNERTDRKGTLVCLSEQEMDIPISRGKKQRKIRTKMVFPEGKLFPVSYSYESSTGSSYDVKVEGGQIIKTPENGTEVDESITPLEEDMRMLDLTVFHTIDYWIRKYDVNKRGPQVMQTYLLPAGSIKQLPIVPAEIFMPEHDSKALQLKNYEIKVGDEVAILLWVDKDNRLYRMFIQGPNIEVIRSDLFEQLSSKEKSFSQKGS